MSEAKDHSHAVLDQRNTVVEPPHEAAPGPWPTQLIATPRSPAASTKKPTTATRKSSGAPRTFPSCSR